MTNIYKSGVKGKSIRGFIKKSDFRLPKEIYETGNYDIPGIIMIGPGTGVAPFRALLQDIEDMKKKGRFPY